MSADFDLPPIYDPLTLNGDRISDSWSNWESSFIQNLVLYLSSTGIFIPRMTLAQREMIFTPQNGQVVYNIDSDEFQGFQGGVWKVFTLT